MNGTQLGVHDGRNEFWNINIGHVLQIIIMVCGGLTVAAGGISEFATMRSDNASEKSAIADLKVTIGDMRDWRERQDADNAQFHSVVNSSFDDIKRHLERLDWMVGNRADIPPNYVPPVLRRRP